MHGKHTDYSVIICKLESHVSDVLIHWWLCLTNHFCDVLIYWLWSFLLIISIGCYAVLAMAKVSVCRFITGCTVAQHCCKGDQPFQWETQI